MKNINPTSKTPYSGQDAFPADAERIQEQLLLVNRALRLQSACNEVLIRASSEQQLLNEICRLVVERGGYLMAWVGMAEKDEARSVHPVAHFGHEAGYLEQARITWADMENGRGTSGAAIRTGKTQVNQNFLTNPAMKPWLAAALENGYQSCISLPLQDGPASFGVLTIYSVKPNAFNAEEAQLLEDLSENLAYGILHLREHIRREQVEKDLLESEERYRVLVEHAPEAIVVFDVEQNLLVDVNANAEALFECGRDELLKRSPLDFHPPAQMDAFMAEPDYHDYIELSLKGKQPVFERLVISAKGRECLCEVRLVRLPSGNRKLIRGSFIDITARRRTEFMAQQFGRVLQGSFNEIYLFDSRSLRYIQTSEGANKNLGYSAAELKRLTPLDLKPLFTRERFDWMIAPLRSGEKQLLLFETIHRRKNGTTYPVEIRLQLMPGDPPVFLAIVQDVSERKKHEHELNQSTAAYAALVKGTQHLKSILDNLFAYVALLDADGVIQEVNKATLERSGDRREDMIGQSFHDGPWWSYDPKVRGQLLEAIEAARRGQTRRYDVVVKMGDDLVPIDFQISPVRDEHGRIVGLLPTAVDISERIRAEQRIAYNESLYRGLFENMTSGVAVFAAVNDGTDFIFKDFNRTSELLEKVKREDIIGKRLTECFPGIEDHGVLEVLRRVWKTGQTEHFPLSFRQKDRVLGWRDNHVYRLASGEVVAVYEDVTTRKQAEHALKESMSQLEKKELAKSRFLAAAGHDLRQPLSAVSLYLDVLKHSDPTDEQNEVLQCLNQSMNTFKSLLDALLNISKLDAGVIKPELSTISVSELIIWLEDNFAPMAAEKPLDFRLFFPVKEELFVRSDVGLVKSILMNFVSNAIKFTPDGGAILVCARRRGTEVLFQVWDTGIGIPEEHINRIFDEFYQINNPHRNRGGGLGLGLSIVERTLALLERNIECRSLVGRGSVFGFKLPLDHAPSGDTRHAHVTLQEEVVSGFFASGKRFVVVEDDVLVAEALCKTLVMMGAEVKWFHNAEDAMRYPNIGNATYYIVDYMLGGQVNGLQFLSLLGKNLGKPINAVLMTGDTSSTSAREFATCGWPVLHKPANISQLLTCLKAQAL
jgi:PAS domain S-box-containing protein